MQHLFGVSPCMFKYNSPQERKLNIINTYLKPLMEELQELYKGVVLPCSDGIPASRKVCGFLGHNARLGCNKCYKEFLSENVTLKISQIMVALIVRHRSRVQNPSTKMAVKTLSETICDCDNV